jgi:hypothetical protein
MGISTEPSAREVLAHLTRKRTDAARTPDQPPYRRPGPERRTHRQPPGSALAGQRLARDFLRRDQGALLNHRAVTPARCARHRPKGIVMRRGFAGRRIAQPRRCSRSADWWRPLSGESPGGVCVVRPRRTGASSCPSLTGQPSRIKTQTCSSSALASARRPHGEDARLTRLSQKICDFSHKTLH